MVSDARSFGPPGFAVHHLEIFQQIAKLVRLPFKSLALIRRDQWNIRSILTWAINLELLKDQTTKGLIRSLKWFIARCGRPRKIYCTVLRQRQKFRSCGAMAQVDNERREASELSGPSIHTVTLKFNLSRAPWWWGQFERLVGFVKRALYRYKSSGRASLTWKEFEEVIQSNLY